MDEKMDEITLWVSKHQAESEVRSTHRFGFQSARRRNHMDSACRLITAMAEECRGTIMEWRKRESGLPKPLQPKHLEWMCSNIQKHAEDWPATKLHRWIGFVQCAMMANRMLDLGGAKAMFDKAKVAHGEISEDLLDHLDPTSSFELEIGGEG